jgi:hypothetical protein
MAGLAILTVVTSLWVVGLFHFIVEANLRSLQNATQKLTGVVQNLSDRIDVPLQIAERAKQPEPDSIDQRVVYANSKVKVDRTKYSRAHSLSMMRHNKKASTMRIRRLRVTAAAWLRSDTIVIDPPDKPSCKSNSCDTYDSRVWVFLDERGHNVSQ